MNSDLRVPQKIAIDSCIPRRYPNLDPIAVEQQRRRSSVALILLTTKLP
jgi:hypothetical protein